MLSVLISSLPQDIGAGERKPPGSEDGGGAQDWQEGRPVPRERPPAPLCVRFAGNGFRVCEEIGLAVAWS